MDVCFMHTPNGGTKFIMKYAHCVWSSFVRWRIFSSYLFCERGCGAQRASEREGKILLIINPHKLPFWDIFLSILWHFSIPPVLARARNLYCSTQRDRNKKELSSFSASKGNNILLPLLLWMSESECTAATENKKVLFMEWHSALGWNLIFFSLPSNKLKHFGILLLIPKFIFSLTLRVTYATYHMHTIAWITRGEWHGRKIAFCDDFQFFSSSMELFLPLLRISALYFANPARLHAERARDRESKSATRRNLIKNRR